VAGGYAGPSPIAKFDKCAIPLIAEDEARAPGRVLGVYLLKLGIDRAGNQQNVRIAVVVQIHEPGSPTDEATLRTETGLGGNILKLAFSVVAIEAGGLVLEVRLDHVEVAVEVVVSDTNAHAAQLLAVAAEGDTAK
jgi:hypothetical protein